MISGIREMDMEVCVTLGMIDGDQAKELKDAGLTAYNHNLDTSREFYPTIITTRSYDERLKTLSHVRDAGINVCSGGILGLGETDADRIGLANHLVGLGIFRLDVLHFESFAALLGDDIECAANRGQHAEREHVDLQEAERFEVVLVPLNSAAVRHRRVFHRD